ncbi:MAG TPA: zinc-binding dehydrogenase [Candidatus Acidoferrales bacterium]|nr:zinc-binding dehydrogenase [Candidatus Acidoferrales bacterium]
MKATVYHGPGDVRVESVPDPRIQDGRDAIVRVTRAAICGSDLWFYRGVTKPAVGNLTGHEFVRIVEEVGSEVRDVRRGDAVIAPFAWSDGTCEFCRDGLQTSCVHVGFFGGEEKNGGQAELVRVPYADGTLVKMPDAIASDEGKLNASVTLCDVMGTGHYGAVAAETKPHSTVVVVGDGAVGLCAVLSASKILGAERIIAVGHNAKRLELAKRFGATHAFDSNDPQAREQIVDLTQGGAPHVVEAVGNQESLDLAVSVARPGGTVGFVGVPHADKVPMETMFYNHVTLRGGPAPVRQYLPQLISGLETGHIDPSPVLDLALPLSRVAEGYAAMDDRRAIKVVLAVS